MEPCTGGWLALIQAVLCFITQDSPTHTVMCRETPKEHDLEHKKDTDPCTDSLNPFPFFTVGPHRFHLACTLCTGRASRISSYPYQKYKQKYFAKNKLSMNDLIDQYYRDSIKQKHMLIPKLNAKFYNKIPFHISPSHGTFTASSFSPKNTFYHFISKARELMLGHLILEH